MSPRGVSVELLTPAAAAEYSAFVERRPTASFQHRLIWHDLLVRCLPVSPLVLVASAAGEPVGTLPLFDLKSPVHGRRLVCLPLCRSLPLLANDPEVARALLAAAVDLGRSADFAYLELRGELGVPAPAGFERYDQFVAFAIDLTGGAAAVRQACHSRSVRWALRRSERAGVEVERGGTLADFAEAHRLAVETRRRQGAPVLPADFFAGLGELAARTGDVWLFFARWRGRRIAAQIVLRHGEVAYGFDAVSRQATALRRLRPNNVALWAAIREALDQGCTTFDLGSNHRANAGLTGYKAFWGARPQPAPHHFRPLRVARIPLPDIALPRYRVAQALLRRVPLAWYPQVTPWTGPEVF